MNKVANEEIKIFFVIISLIAGLILIFTNESTSQEGLAAIGVSAGVSISLFIDWFKKGKKQ